MSESKFEDFDADVPFTINYQNIISDKNMSRIIRCMAVDMMQNPYMSIGDFFARLNDEEVQYLIDQCEDVEDPKFSEIVLMAEMLAVAEGLEQGNEDEIHKRTNQFCVLVAVESLGRKGLAKVFRENMSFGEDMSDKIVAIRA
jgi:hypothetical protein